MSSGSAHTVPSSIAPKEVVGAGVDGAVTEAKRVEDPNIEKVDCFRVEGTYSASPTTLWIDKKSFLLRRIDSKRKFDDFSTQETTTYEPVIDDEIPEKALEFDPPKGK